MVVLLGIGAHQMVAPFIAAHQVEISALTGGAAVLYAPHSHVDAGRFNSIADFYPHVRDVGR
jgi:hypothetical protein